MQDLKMMDRARGVKIQDMTLKDQIATHENARHEIALLTPAQARPND